MKPHPAVVVVATLAWCTAVGSCAGWLAYRWFERNVLAPELRRES